MQITLDYDTYKDMETTIKGLREENEKLREDHGLIVIENKGGWKDSATGRIINDIKIKYTGKDEAIMEIIDQKDKVVQRLVDRYNELLSRKLIARIFNK